MDECVDVMAAAMQAASAGKVGVPPRLIMPLIDGSAHFALMPGSSSEPRVYGAKVISLHTTNPAHGRPAVQGFVTLFDHVTGKPVAIIEGGELTAIRTAAASGLATRHLARTGAHTHGIFGTGVQAITHIDAIAVARPITEVLIWGRDAGKARALADAQTGRSGLVIRATAAVGASLTGVTVTTTDAESSPPRPSPTV